MKILLDHCLPRRLARAFPSHTVRTTADQAWERLRNGKLLAAASKEFDLFLTIDKNLKHEQWPRATGSPTSSRLFRQLKKS